MDKMFFNGDLNTDTKGAIAFRKHFRVNLEKAPAELPNKDVHEMRRQIQDSMTRTLDQAERDGRDLAPSEDDAFRYGQMLLDEINFQLDRRKAEGTDQPIVPRPFHGENGFDSRSGQVETARSIIAPTKRSYRDLFGNRASDGGFGSFDEFLDTVVSRRADPRLEQRTFLANIGHAGGYAIPDVWAAEIFDSALENEVIRPRARVFPMASGILHVPAWDQSDHSGGTVYGGLTPEWLGEAEQATIQVGKLRNMDFSGKKLAVFCEASREAAEDGLALREQIGPAMMNAVRYGLDGAFIAGSGVGRPMGILNSGALVSYSRATANQISYADVTGMFARLHPAGMGKAVWIANQSILPQLVQIRDTGNNNLWLSSAVQGMPPTLMGLPLLFSEKCPALGSKGDLMLCDLSMYGIGLRKEIIFEMSNSAGWQRDVLSFRVIIRCDGMPLIDRPFQPENGNTVSAFVALDVP